MSTHPRVDDVPTFAVPGHPALSPDGDRCLHVLRTTDAEADRDDYEDLFREIFAELAGVRMPEPLRPPARPVRVGLDRHVGTYERASTSMEVFRDGDSLRLRTTVTGPLAEMLPDTVHEYTMVPVDEDQFLVMEPAVGAWMPVTFYDLATGERYVHHEARATPKVS
ncbi:hypothetical protein [Kibdelosporangium phytohabitans]|uniref:Uncharacterized protein n=1 Tax=Kibdelosporangium phytohabitans TaxID=860235 RepID=A0A0N9I393_9PSEU|nr:hypothetical protein [Kibdelosporangium phytohabitans]ALG09230.1 hypothetical protein AOZ06_22015 [Kibdelosporangium phytohabitans]MBE1469534.1 hypothetical protein [Kibdelosporangium phytohabitans]